MGQDIKNDVNQPHLETIAEFIREIKYGSVTVIIQDGKIIQIDKTEKCRIKN